MSTPEERKAIDKQFKTLDIFTYCFTCAALLIGAAKKASFWGRRTTQIGQTHRKVTQHDVYIRHK